MLRERSLEPLARFWWIDQRIKKNSPIPVGQNERLMLRDRPPGGVSERRHAEIRQLASLKLRRPLNEGLSGLIDPKPESLFSKPSVEFCCRGHRYLQPHMYVNWTNFSRQGYRIWPMMDFAKS